MGLRQARRLYRWAPGSAISRRLGDRRALCHQRRWQGPGRPVRLSGQPAASEPVRPAAISSKKQSEYASAWMLDDACAMTTRMPCITVQRWNWSHVNTAGGEQPAPGSPANRCPNRKEPDAGDVAPLVDCAVPDRQRRASRASPIGHGQQAEATRSTTAKATARIGSSSSTRPAMAIGTDPVAFNRAGDGVYFFCGWQPGIAAACASGMCRRVPSRRSGVRPRPARPASTGTFDGQDLLRIRSMPGRTAVTLLDRDAPGSKVAGRD